jgi:acyl-CoA synthetase (AMP-forming)/AMP-acid ligase II
MLLRCVNYGVGEAAILPDDVDLAVMSFYFNGGRQGVLAALLHGATVIILPRFEPHSVLQNVGRFRATSLYLVPTMCERLLEVQRERHYPVDSMRMIRTTGSALHESTRRELRERLAPFVFSSYGSTDTSAITMPSTEVAGRPIWGLEVAIVDDDGQEVPTGEPGEIWCRGPLVCDGYYNNPEANAAAFRDGWFATGDVGIRHPDGRVQVTGRKKNMIKSGGICIYPEEIEALLKQYPGIQDVVVVGLPDPQWGEAAHAMIVPGAEQPAAEAVIAYCKQHLAPYKAPKTVVFSATPLPQTAVGKADRPAIQQLLATSR